MGEQAKLVWMWRRSSFVLFLLVTIYSTNALSDTPTNNLTSPAKGGRCPESKMDTRLCTQQVDQCTEDAQCSGESLCCSTGCNQVCILPSYTACEQVRSSAERRARSLEPKDAKLVSFPECDPATGRFKEVQCDASKGCYCVDNQGFEVAGTRARSLEHVNCSNPNPKCEGPMCRMLCPHGFELDKDGCEMCECRNVCKGVKCPGSLKCEVEEAPCTTEPCPPLPTCKQPRSLDSFCTYGAPLTIPDIGAPFLCGTSPGQPSCPAAFQCNVQSGNEYGVCCASNNNFEKPGSCPVVAMTQNQKECPSVCRHDLDCPEFDKCCFTQGCGKQCSKPANSTACLQQKHIAELLSAKELEGKGYIPQCSQEGNFLPKQCSRNGKVCWCVGPDGKNFAQSLGPSENVNCSSTYTRQRASLRSDDSYDSTCDKVLCPPTIQCEFGFKTDRNGCPTCDCVESPCSYFNCPAGSQCNMIRDNENGPLKPTCLSESLFVNPCPLGIPLTHADTAKVIACSESAPTCPSSHICVVVSPNKAGLCCPNKPRVEPTKVGMCPFLSSSNCGSNNNTLGLSHKKCGSDNDCENSMKCCAAGDCTVCADPLFHQDLQKSHPIPTMCQYLRDADNKVGEIFSKFKLAKSKPQCKETGEFQEIQCDFTHCMCVDEYGGEIPGTMMEKMKHNLTTEFCIKARYNPKCLEMNCRLACDYGYETLDGCKICECRNPCMFKNECGADEQCEMVDIDCWDEHCPPMPFCIPKALAALAKEAETKEVVFQCPKGKAFLTDANETLTCNPRARMLQCPDEYFCNDIIISGNELGFCCPILEEQEFGQLFIAEDRKEPEGNFLYSDGPEQGHSKQGQCPYLMPFNSGSCESECETDGHCPSTKKCCLNSCGGSQCIQPLLMTACQHQKQILEHKARESGMPSKRVFIPQCDVIGAYVQVQSFGKFSWCVDSAGQEIQGTRVPQPQKPNCKKPSQCPQTKCSLQCEFGLNLDSKGCPVCECKPSPCETDVRCPAGEECRMMQLNCISEPCPPVPLCLPRLDNPCAYGAPLSFEETGDRVPCGNGYGNCPSSHKCNISPFGEYAVCCPKPKEVCFESKEAGNCKAVITKWFFNSSSNECQPFYYSGCGGNNNQFNSKAECLSVCPALSHCERIREKNSELVKKYHHMSYVPKCNSRNGEWEPVQCFEEVGMCWCVNKKGEPVKGTMTNGVPNCQARRGRLLTSASTINSLVCEPGVTVHKCSKATCEDKICFGQPNARCKINPCGGCNPKWISETGDELDCASGLSQCQQEMQQVMNSPAWLNQGFTAASASLPNFDDVDSSGEREMMEQQYSPAADASSSLFGPFGNLGNALSELLRGHSIQNMPGSQPMTHTSTKVRPIYADFGNGNRVMGIMSSSVTIMGDSLEENQPNKRKNMRLPNSPVKSIADILADLMTSQSRHGPEHPGYFSDGLDDLMSTGTHMSREMLPPMPMVPDFPFVRETGSLESESESLEGSRASRVRREADSEVPDSLAMESSSGSSEEVRVPMPRRMMMSSPEILVSILPRHKMGSCPPPSQFSLFNLFTGTCADECQHDDECDAGLKCCLSKCGLKCMEPQNMDPESLRVAIMNLNNQEEDVPIAPSVLMPSYENLEPPTMLVSLPDCNAETGNYNPEQSQGDLSWCVSPDGQPILETFTRGKVTCSSNGTLVQRYVRGPVCSDPDQTPMVCKDQCLHSTCSLHPDAVCVMDVCDGCTPTYYKPSGEKVRCEEKCQQPSGEAGLCRASILRYTFNVTRGFCEEFIYGGCQGNENNFETMTECRSECEKAVHDVCHLPVKSGPCRASMPRWFFNPLTQNCEIFDYGGCGGNGNNFMSKSHCESRCPDLVLCPSISTEGELNSCSRTTACQNVTCANHQVDDFMCHVDPCTCQALLKDFNGNEVNCDQIQEHSQNSASFPQSKSEDYSDAFVLESDVIENPNPVPITSGENQVLRILPTFALFRKTRCQQMSEQNGGIYTCDFEGKFMPRQCLSGGKCFCVDESGKEVEESFSKTCVVTPISQVTVALSFPVGDDISSVQLGVEMQEMLRTMGAHLSEERVEVEVLPGSTNLNFALKGENKVDVSYWLEQLVIENAIGVQDKDKFYPADFSTSKFHHERESTNNVESSSSSTTTTTTTEKTDEEETATELDAENEIPIDIQRLKEVELDVIAAESLLDGDQNTVAIMLTLVAAITACLVVFGMFLAFQKKKSTGSYPKKPFETLAFSSQIYEIEKKVPLKDTTIPTFKVTPYVNNVNEKEKKCPKT